MTILRSVEIVVLVLLLSAFAACDTKPSERRPEHNVIKEYVNTPRDKARDAKNRVEAAQDKVRRQSKELGE